MRKKEFLALLEKRLSVLDEKEIKDIISEYEGITLEKIKNGESEEEAIKSFGDVNELASEILKAYKINPKYTNKEKTREEKTKDFENTIKSWANSLADITKDAFNGAKSREFTLELVFEMLIKFLFLLLGLSLLSLPFRLIYHLGTSILDIAFFPLDAVLGFIWGVLVFVLYFVVCAFAFSTVFKKYFSHEDAVNVKKAIAKHLPEEDKRKAEKKINEEEEKYTEKKTEKEKIRTSGISSVFLVIIRIFVIICFLFPGWCVNIALYFAACFAIYFLFVGINTIGIIFALVGIIILSTYFLNLIEKAIYFRFKRVTVAPIIVSLVFIFMGFILSLAGFSRMERVDGLPSNSFNIHTESYSMRIDEELTAYNCTLEYREDLPDNNVLVEASYYNEIIRINDARISPFNKLRFDIEGIRNNRNNYYKLYDLVIDNLKDNKLYDYEDFADVRVTIFANQNTINNIKCIERD